jgi:DNA ligase-1
MAPIAKPMLAEHLPSGALPAFPVAATPKVDGIRALKVDGALLSRSFKPIPNKHIRALLGRVLPDGVDGEIMYGATFQECTSAVMKSKGYESATGQFTFYWFDYVREGADEPYAQRMSHVESYMEANAGALAAVADSVRVVPLLPERVTCKEQLDAYEARCLADGFEGVMIRKPDGRYKFGRSTVREGLLLKIKRFRDAEAVVIGAEELLHNDNAQQADAFGNMKRSTHRDNKRSSGKLGALCVESADGVRFRVGTGFTDAQRVQFWEERESLLGALVKYKFLDVGVKEAPRHPVFLGFRDGMDT